MSILIEEYVTSSEKLDVDNRLKVGEVLTKTIKNFGELVPSYGIKLVNTFLIGAKHEDLVLRASSLSNLGEVCKLLNYSLSLNIHEVINCLSSLLETDNALEVKRAAALVLKMIVEGLNKETFLSVLGSSIVPFYKLLTRVKATSHDEIVVLNCQLASEYVNEMMKHSMFPKQTFQKEIKVLRP